MKKIIATVAVGAGLALTALAGDPPRPDHRVVISPLLPVAERKPARDVLFKYLTYDAVPGTQLKVYCGLTMNEILRVDVPVLKIDGPRAREMRIERAFEKFDELWDKHRNDPNVGRSDLGIVEALEELARTAGPNTRILLWGGVVYGHPEKARHWGFLTADGAPTVPPSSVFGQGPAEHPHGALGRSSLPSGAAVWMKHPQESFPAGFDGLKLQLRDFYDDYVKVLGAAGVVGFGSDAGAFLREMCRPELPANRRILSVPPPSPKSPPPLVLPKVTAAPSALLAPLTDIFVADHTASMAPYLERTARQMALAPRSLAHRYALVIFGDYFDPKFQPATLYSEHENPAEIAAAFRGAPLVTVNKDTEEAMGEGARVVRDLLRSRGQRGVNVTFFSDARAKTKAECPPGGADYIEMFADLVADGHHVTLVACGNLDTRGWVPGGVAVKKLAP